MKNNELKSKNKQIFGGNAILLVVLIFFSLNKIQTLSVSVPSSILQPKRYLLYWLMYLASATATNMLVMYLGYHANKLRNAVQKFSKAYVFFISITLMTVLFIILVFHQFSYGDLLAIIFPISYGNFPLIAPLFIIIIFGYQIYLHINQVKRRTFIAGFAFLIWFVLLIPILFNKSVWNINDVSSIVWLLFVFAIGILISRVEITMSKVGLNRMRYIAILCSILAVLIVLICLKTVPITGTPGNVGGRLYSSYFAPMFLLSTLFFLSIGQIDFKVALFKKTLGTSLDWVLLGTYFVTEFSPVEYRLSLMRINTNIGFNSWMFQIGVELLILVFLITMVSLFILYLIKVTPVSLTIEKYKIDQIEDLLLLFKWLKVAWKKAWRYLFVFGMGYLLTFVQMASITVLTGKIKITQTPRILLGSVGPLLLNGVIFFLLFLMLFAIVNRFWYVFVGLTGFYVLLTIAECIKIKLRDEPILPADLRMLSATSDLLGMVNPSVLIVAGIFILVLIGIAMLMQRKIDKKYRIHGLIKRTLMIMVSLVFFSGTLFMNHKNSFSSVISTGFNVGTSAIDQISEARVNGPVIQFLQGLDTTVMSKPSDYSQSKIDTVMKRYNKTAKTINMSRKYTMKNQDFLFVLSESFSNPNRVPNLKVTPNPIPYLLNLKKHVNSGLMLSTGYGGGTANMEWQSLTGLSISNLSASLTTPYTQLVPQQKKSPNITNLFTKSIAIHPYNASLYNRINVFKKFGFDKFYYQGSRFKLSYNKKIDKNPYVSDDSAYKQMLKIVNENKKGSNFIQLSTMQNHMPFSNYYTNNRYKVSGNSATKSNETQIKNYSDGLSYTDKSLQMLISKLNKIKKPITMVWYGDHLAALYNKDSMKKYGLQLHETDYFIYSNRSHRLIKKSALVSPYSFPALALKVSDTKVTPYYAMVTKVTEELPAMTIDPTESKTNTVNGGNIFVKPNGKQINESNLSKKQKQLLHDYRLIQYDLTAGKQYSAKWAEQKLTN